MSPLHFAAMNGHEEVILNLIKNGANIDAQNFVCRKKCHLIEIVFSSKYSLSFPYFFIFNPKKSSNISVV